MSLITLIKSIFGLGSKNNHVALSPGDRLLKCEDCRKSFVFDAGEQRFFKSKGFTDPKRCPECREKVRSKSRRRYRGFRGGRGFGRKPSVIDGRSPYADER